MNETVKDRIKIFIKDQKLSQLRFEKAAGLSNGYVNNFKGNLGAEKLESILNAFPELNRDWLLYGEGEMLKGAVTQTSNGADSPNVNGNNNNIGGSVEVRKLIDELAAQRRLTETAQKQLGEALNTISALVARLTK